MSGPLLMATVVESPLSPVMEMCEMEDRVRMSWRDFLFAPVDIASLVCFRILFGAMMVYHVASTLKSGWIDYLYVRPVMHFTYPGFGWVQPWPGQGMYWHFYVMAAAAAGITFGACYRLCAFVFAMGMAHVFLIEKAFYLNHYYLIVLLSGLLVVLPAHRALSIDSWLRPSLRSQSVPAWTLWLLRLQLAIPYFYGGLAKLDSDWLQGYPLGMWLKRRADLPWIGPWLEHASAGIVFAYGGMLLDLLIVPLLLWKRTRWPAYILAIVFHGLNSVLFEIGIFPWLMMAATLIFFPPDWPRRLRACFRWEGEAPAEPNATAGRRPPEAFSFDKASGGRRAIARIRLGGSLALPALGILRRVLGVSLIAPRSDATESEAISAPHPFSAPSRSRQNLVVSALAVYVAWQLLFPLRGILYPQAAIWTEEGHHFAWQMMLREKDVGIRFYIRNPRTGGGGVVDVSSFLTERQMSRMGKDSDMILTFVHFLRDHFRKHGQGTLQIRVLALVSLNGRKPQLMLDPGYDYAQVPRIWGPQPWILPLKEPLRRDPWVVPLTEWEQHVEAPSPAEMIQPAPKQWVRATVGNELVEEEF